MQHLSPKALTVMGTNPSLQRMTNGVAYANTLRAAFQGSLAETQILNLERKALEFVSAGAQATSSLHPRSSLQ